MTKKQVIFILLNNSYCIIAPTNEEFQRLRLLVRGLYSLGCFSGENYMKLNYIGVNKKIEKRLNDFEEKININDNIKQNFNKDPIDIEFYNSFDSINEINCNDRVNKEKLKEDDAFCSNFNNKIYVKNSSLNKSADEFDFMLAHEVAHLFISSTGFFIPHKIGDLHQNINNIRFKEELADYLAFQWGFAEGFASARTKKRHQNQNYIDCFVKDEKEFAIKITKYKNLLDSNQRVI